MSLEPYGDFTIIYIEPDNIYVSCIDPNQIIFIFELFRRPYRIMVKTSKDLTSSESYDYTVNISVHLAGHILSSKKCVLLYFETEDIFNMSIEWNIKFNIYTT